MDFEMKCQYHYKIKDAKAQHSVVHYNRQLWHEIPNMPMVEFKKN